MNSWEMEFPDGEFFANSLSELTLAKFDPRGNSKIQPFCLIKYIASTNPCHSGHTVITPVICFHIPY